MLTTRAGLLSIALLLAGCGSLTGWNSDADFDADPGSRAAVATISKGQAVVLESYAVPHGRTLFAYIAHW